MCSLLGICTSTRAVHLDVVQVHVQYAWYLLMYGYGLPCFYTAAGTVYLVSVQVLVLSTFLHTGTEVQCTLYIYSYRYSLPDICKVYLVSWSLVKKEALSAASQEDTPTWG